MSVNWSDTALVVFDMDGTLYDQRPLRAAMAGALIGATLRERSVTTARILRIYRRIGENLPEEMPQDFCNYRLSETAAECGVSEKRVRETIDDWMHDRPLKVLKKHRPAGLQSVFRALSASGRKIAVWSDYPVQKKLASLGLQADLEVWTGDGNVSRPKPHPQGLSFVLETLGFQPQEALLIGDRFDRDWQAAKAWSVPALIRSKKRDRRAPTFWNYTDPIFEPLLAGH